MPVNLEIEQAAAKFCNKADVASKKQFCDNITQLIEQANMTSWSPGHSVIPHELPQA